MEEIKEAVKKFDEMNGSENFTQKDFLKYIAQEIRDIKVRLEIGDRIFVTKTDAMYGFGILMTLIGALAFYIFVIKGL